MAIPISVMILTLDEQINLPDCMRSVSWCDDIVVLDSYSKDRTTQIAEDAGARVVQRKFDNWSAHQNWAMRSIDFKYDWVLYLDADERLTDALREEIARIARDDRENRVAFYCGRRNYFMSKWIRRAMPPGLVMRLFKPRYIHFERLVNPTPVIDGPYGYLKHLLDHDSFRKGLTEWIQKHIQYAQLEAIEGRKLLGGESESKPSLFSSEPAVRRKALKNLSFRLPMRPAIKFIYMYIAKGGILDGRAGLSYCMLQAVYEYMIAIMMKELDRRERGLPV